MQPWKVERESERVMSSEPQHQNYENRAIERERVFREQNEREKM